MRERLAGRSMPSAVWRSTSFVSTASVPFLMDTGQPPHAQTEAWPGWAFVRELISPIIQPGQLDMPFTLCYTFLRCEGV